MAAARQLAIKLSALQQERVYAVIHSLSGRQPRSKDLTDFYKVGQ